MNDIESVTVNCRQKHCYEEGGIVGQFMSVFSKDDRIGCNLTGSLWHVNSLVWIPKW
jgi:hypothetical protein